MSAISVVLGAASVVVAHEMGVLNGAGVWAATALVFGIRIVAVVLYLNAPQTFDPGDHP